SGSLCHLPQHVVQDAAVSVVLDFLRRFQAYAGLEGGFLAFRVGGLDVDFLFGAVGQAGDVEGLGAVQAQAFGVFAVNEGQRQHAHADQVGAVDALVAFGNHGLDAEQARALGRPVARGAGAVFLAGNDNQRRAVVAVLHGRVIDRHDFLVGEVGGETAFGAFGNLVFDAHVGEGAAHHDFMVAAAR